MNFGLGSRLAALLLAAPSLVAAADAGVASPPKPPRFAPIDLSGFGDSAHHWRNIRDETRFIQVEPGQPAYAPTQVREIVENLLRFQRANGG